IASRAPCDAPCVVPGPLVPPSVSSSCSFCFLHLPRPSSPTLFPYTTLFRSWAGSAGRWPPRSPQGPRPPRPRTPRARHPPEPRRSEEHTSELQSRFDLVCRLLLETKTTTATRISFPTNGE